MEILSGVPMPDALQSYYQAALVGLRYVESRRPSGRRFGEDADALWKGFAGELTTADRLDLLIRDAEAEWPGAFGARTVFSRSGVAEDEPFGVGWDALEPPTAEELWRASVRSTAPKDVADVLGAAAAAWGLSLEPFELEGVSSTSKLLFVGPSAVAAGIARFAKDPELGWAEQVLVIATPEAHRQLAALAPALINVNKATQLLSAIEAANEKFGPRRVLMSRDADPADRSAAEGLVGAS